MKLRKAAKFLPLVLSAINAANAAPITRSATADNLNLIGAWTSGALPTTADTATWDASSTLANTMGANNTWGGLNVSSASAAISISGANNLLLDNVVDANTTLDTGATNFTWGVTGAVGNFNINGVAGGTPVGSSTATGATFAGSGLVTISSTGTKNWSSNASTNGVTNITFNGTLALRGAAIPAVGSLPGNWIALGGGGGAASALGTTLQTGSFALDTGDGTSCGALILTHGWNGQYLKLNSLKGTGSIRADWGLSAGTQTRGLELNQAGDTVLSGSILIHNGSSQRRNVSFVKKGLGTLTLTGGLGSSATAGGAVSSLNFDILEGAIQLGDGTRNPAYVNAANWDAASAFTISSGAQLRFMSSSDFTWSRAITGGSGTVEISNDGTPGEGNVIFTANSSAFSGNINLNAGSLRMGPSLGSGTLTVKTGTFIAVGLPATNGTSQVGSLVLEDGTESDYRIGTINDKISIANSLTVPSSGTHTINLSGTPTAGGTIKLIDYSGTDLSPAEFARFELGIIPAGAATYQLVNNSGETSIDLLITLEDQLWKGSSDGNWDDTTTNWVLAGTPGTPLAYNFEHPSVFNDNPATSAVIVGAGISPTKVTFNNSITNYEFTGDAIGGAGGLEKNGSATTTLAQANTYTGGTIVNGGKLQIGNGGTTGDIGAGAVVVAAGSTLEFNRSNAVPATADLDYKTNAKLRNVSGNGDIVLTGGLMLFNYTGGGLGFSETGSWSGFSGNLTIKGGSEFQTIRNGSTALGSGDVILGDATTSGSLSAIEGNWTWTNDISLTGAANKIISRSAVSPRTLKLQGVIGGSGGLALQDAAAAMTDINRGFILTGSNTLNGTLNIAAGVPVRIGGVPGNVDVSGTGLNAAASGSLGSATVTNDGTLTFSRTDAHDVNNTISGSGALRVGIPIAAALGDTSTQVVTYTGTATHTGTTTVHNGALIVGTGGSLGGASVTVDTGATIGGPGMVTAPLTAAGTVAPGTGVGTLSVTGNTSLAGILAVEVDGAAADKLMVTGDLALGGVLALAETGAGFTAASYVVAECSGALSGTLAAPLGYTVTNTGNQVVLTKITGSDFDTWIAGFNLGGQIGIDQDPDFDGFDNGMEFILKGGNPEIPGGTQSPTGLKAGGNFIFTFERDDRAKGLNAGIIPTVEAGTDLATWPLIYTVGADTASSSSGVVITNDADANPDTVTVTIPTSAAPEFFARLKATKNP